MKRLLILLLVTPAFAQVGNVTMQLFPGNPSGNCHSRLLGLNTGTGALFTCNAGGVWVPIGAGGGGGTGTGTVTSFSSGNLPPLFTTSVTNPGTAPALSFFLNNIAPNTLWGNFTSSNNVPSWFTPTGDVSMANGQFTLSRMTFGGTSIPLGAPPATGEYLTFNGTTITGGTPAGGGGGGSGLLGCATATSGNLTCDTSVAVTATGAGQLSLSNGSLPAAPSGPIAMLIADPSGNPLWSNGSGNPFHAIGGGTSVVPTSLQFGGSSGPVFNLGDPPVAGQCLTFTGTLITGGACGGGGGGGVQSPVGGVTTIQ